MSDDIKARLRKKRPAPIPVNMSHQVYKNPDGPEAAAHIEVLEAEVARLRRSRDRYREEWEKARAHQEVAATRAIKRARLSQDKEQET